MIKESQEIAQHIRETYRYDPKTEKVFWKDRYNGKEAFTTKHSRGYLHGAVFGKKYLAHRIVWLLYYGQWPKGYIDHINKIRCDNRISNLRVVSHQENCKNKNISLKNTSGVVGVGWHKQHGKWMASIKVFGKSKHLGLFDNFDDAVAARKEAEAKFGFHENHGKQLTNH